MAGMIWRYSDRDHDNQLLVACESGTVSMAIRRKTMVVMISGSINWILTSISFGIIRMVLLSDMLEKLGRSYYGVFQLVECVREAKQFRMLSAA